MADFFSAFVGLVGVATVELPLVVFLLPVLFVKEVVFACLVLFVWVVAFVGFVLFE
jgi:hypothetical protein